MIAKRAVEVFTAVILLILMLLVLKWYMNTPSTPESSIAESDCFTAMDNAVVGALHSGCMDGCHKAIYGIDQPLTNVSINGINLWDGDDPCRALCE